MVQGLLEKFVSTPPLMIVFAFQATSKFVVLPTNDHHWILF
jgi:hypothetical protein